MIIILATVPQVITKPEPYTKCEHIHTSDLQKNKYHTESQLLTEDMISHLDKLTMRRLCAYT